MSSIRKVSVVGGAGRLGIFVLEKLVASKRFDVQVVKRAGSSSTFIEGVRVVEADYEDVESLKRAFQGQDAVVSIVGNPGTLSQKNMVDAAIVAGVKRFLPSNFGSNMANPNSRKLPVFTQKVQVEDYIIEKSKTSSLTYSFVYVGPFVDFCIEHKVVIDYSNYTPTVFDDGEAQFSATSMPTIGDAVVGVLSHPEETRNRGVYVSEVVTSQNQLVALAKEIAPSKPWTPKYVETDVVFKPALERMSEGAHDLPTIIPVLLKSIVSPDYGVKFTENDNHLLGIKVRGEDYLKELISPMVS